MFRPYKFKVVVPTATGGAAAPAVAVRFNSLGPISVRVAPLKEGEKEPKLNLCGNGGEAFIIESIGNFDKDGNEVWLGDVLDWENSDGNLERGKVYWDGNSCCYAFRIGRSDGVIPLTTSILRKMTRVGSSFEEPKLDTDAPTAEEIAEAKRKLFEDEEEAAKESSDAA